MITVGMNYRVIEGKQQDFEDKFAGVIDALNALAPIAVAILPVNEFNFFRSRQGIVGNMSVREAFGLAPPPFGLVGVGDFWWWWCVVMVACAAAAAAACSSVAMCSGLSSLHAL